MGARVMRFTILGTIGLLTLLQSNPTRAASDADGCLNANPDASIDYCTVIIQTELTNFITLAAAYSNRGLSYAKKGQYASALEDYAQAIKYLPDSAVPYNNRCYALAQMARLDEALADCQVAVKLKPREPNILDSRGYVYFRMGKYAEAIRDYDAALEILPNLVLSLYGRGAAKLKSGNPEGAAKDFEAAKAVDPSIGKKMAASGLIADFTEREPTIPTSAPASTR